MKIVVGLGNPGAEYANTPHSIGFEAVDAIAAEIGATWETKRQFQCLMAKGSFAGIPVMLVKPQTYMNLSGDAVAPVVKYHNATPADLLVIQDDIDLPAGKMRIRKAGSCGGHNGIRNIIERLGTPGFTRLKLGVGKDKEYRERNDGRPVDGKLTKGRYVRVYSNGSTSEPVNNYIEIEVFGK